MRPRRPPSRGFTLIETALAIVIVATAMLAMVGAHGAFHVQNHWAGKAAQAARLGGEIRERTFTYPVSDPVTGTFMWGPENGEVSVTDWDDVDDFDGLNASFWAGTGPIDASGQVIPGMAGWQQQVAVECVDPADLGTALPDGTSPVVRVSVDVFWQDTATSTPELVTTVTWIHAQ